jgi:hypothetical protein
MRGLKRVTSACTISAGHAFVHNLRRGHCAITADVPLHDLIRVAFDELAYPSDRPLATARTLRLHPTQQPLAPIRSPALPTTVGPTD